LGELFLRGVEEARGSSGERPVALLGNTITLLTQLHRAYTDRMARPAKAEKPELLDRVMEYVETHLSDKITIADVAHVFYVSESTIIQTFRKKMGVSFYRCVTQRRLIAAKSLIAQGQAMEAVAEQVGFSDYSTFYRAFRQEFGISPRQYRKMLEQ
jgi:AraC-like DNA-binding protein